MSWFGIPRSSISCLFPWDVLSDSTTISQSMVWSFHIMTSLVPVVYKVWDILRISILHSNTGFLQWPKLLYLKCLQVPLFTKSLNHHRLLSPLIRLLTFLLHLVTSDMKVSTQIFLFLSLVKLRPSTLQNKHRNKILLFKYSYIYYIY